MSNVKARGSNEIQISNFKKNINLAFWTFGIDWSFACLPVGRDFDI
jgi:hypothetical protein